MGCTILTAVGAASVLSETRALAGDTRFPAQATAAPRSRRPRPCGRTDAMEPERSWMDAVVDGLGAGVGVLTGIVVGVIISIIVRLWEQRRAYDAQFKSLIAEMRFNVSKIEAWMDELARCRTAIAEDRLHDWYGFFDLQSSIFRVAETVLASGLIHERLSFELIKDLQIAASELSVVGAEHMNKQFTEERDTFRELHRQANQGLWMQRKPDVLRLVDYWEAKLRQHQATFTSAISAIESGARTKKRSAP